MLKRIPQIDTQMTHMPFLTQSADGAKVLFYCVADKPAKRTGTSVPWKIHFVIDGRAPQRLNTQLPAAVCECSPTAWQDESGWHVSFTAGGTAAAPTFRLCRMHGPSLEAMSAPKAIQIARAGFVHRDRLVWADPENLIHIREQDRERTLELPGAFIYRVAYRADAPEKLLITGHWQMESTQGGDASGLFTLEHDLATGEQHFLSVDGKPAYKPTVLGDEVLYADRTGEHFEHRQLRTGEKITRRLAQVVVERTGGEAVQTAPPVPTLPQRNCNCGAGKRVQAQGSSRPSCLECVEKHLGAAYVLLTETIAGYAHRLRAVGHLHEAEDESQAWPPLHTAIRAARKAYQTAAVAPDWQVLEDLVSEARTGAQ